jgi:large subunit ribosomal protein L40
MMFQNERRKARMTRLSKLEESVAGTMKALWETDEKFYNQAVAGTREVEKRFPLVMRIPTDTLPTQWWNYKWTSANIKGLGGVAPPG